jgi:hypothetical protein
VHGLASKRVRRPEPPQGGVGALVPASPPNLSIFFSLRDLPAFRRACVRRFDQGSELERNIM